MCDITVSAAIVRKGLPQGCRSSGYGGYQFE